MRNILILLTIGALLAGCSGKGKRAERRQAERERYEAVMDREERRNQRAAARQERNASKTSRANVSGTWASDRVLPVLMKGRKVL